MIIYILALLTIIIAWNKIFKKKKQINKDTVILITGGCMGIGRETALNFAKNHQCQIIIVDYRKDLSQKILLELKDLNCQAYFFEFDLSKTDKIDEFYQQIISQFKHIDILINNAGIVNGKSHQNCGISEVQRVLSVNYLAPVQLMKLYTNQSKGHIVNICSIAAYVPGIGMSDYCASKAALQRYHESLQLELIHYKRNIQLTIINPYMINTNMFQGTKFGLNFLFQTLDMSFVGNQIYEAVIYNKKQVFLPFYYGLMNNMMSLILPISLHQYILAFLQKDFFDSFKGHKKD